jgi:DNA helicase HerA-like ATPase
MVSGDAGQGKTQAIKAIISEIAALDCPILIFDFKNDYGGDFAEGYGFQTIDLNEGLPFNPLTLPPHGESGAQAINHVFEVSGMLAETLGLGDRQKGLLRQALEACYAALGVPLREWVDPDSTPAPSLGDVIAKAKELNDRLAEGLVDRLGLLHGKRLMPSSGSARMSLPDLLKGRVVLDFHTLPNDAQLKRAVAELVLIQLQGHMLRGEQPRALRRLLVFDEAWRAANSKRLIEIAREGRAFGVGVIAGSQFADDLSGELTGNLATKLHLYNSDASKRRRLVQALLGSATGTDAAALSQTLGGLKPFEAVLSNQQQAPYAALRITPHFEREGAQPDALQVLVSAG